ncbi:MAG: permease-like cell division protein FtsX [Ruminococcus sp.]|nr:permease-like cell division protein FtsX [Ruminococcus sp.]
MKSGFGYLLKEGIKSIWHNRMMSLASIGVLISCLLLTGVAELLSLNVTHAMDKIGGTNVTRVFLSDEVTSNDAIYIMDEMERSGNVSKTVFIDKNEAMQEYEDKLREDLYQYMKEDNPFPNAVDVTLEDLSRYDETMAKILSIDGVDSARDTREIAQKLTNLNDLVSTVSLWIVIALVLISIFIISNSIRMTMYSRRFEISIMKSVGATNTFVRIPFVIEGMTIGLISGAVSSGLIMVIYEAVMKAVQNIVSIEFIPYSQVAWWMSLAFVGAGIVIGALGSVLSIGRYLKKEGNELLGW